MRRQIEEKRSRFERLHTQAGVLVAASALALGIEIPLPQSAWTVGGWVLSVIAAILAASVLFPARTPQMGPEAVRAHLLTRPELEGLRDLADTMYDELIGSKKQIRLRGRLLQGGYLLLVLGLICTLFGMINLRIEVSLP